VATVVQEHVGQRRPYLGRRPQLVVELSPPSLVLLALAGVPPDV
jgi:hypothetical protein